MAEDTGAEPTESTEVIKEKKPKVNVKWECPRCGQSIVLHFKAKYPPTCSSNKHTTSGATEMVVKK
jgi:Zn finger protein HypA/HybF involved in hydrogenase expression